MPGQRFTISQPGSVKDDRRIRIRNWQDKIRDPALTILLALLLLGVFIAEPLAARGLPIARVITFTVALVALVIVVMLSDRPGAIVLNLLGFTAVVASQLLGAEWPSVAMDVLGRGGEITAWSTLIWVTAHAVYAPGRITANRLQGAVVVYLSAAMIFASAYGLIWELQPDAFTNVRASAGGDAENAALMYFSLTTLTTTGYGDILAVDPFARSLANLESVLGVFYIAITVARLVTLQSRTDATDP
jgi:Ion channel